MKNEKDLVAFGKYLVSNERFLRLVAVDEDEKSPIPLELSMYEVHHADIENWKGKE